MLTKITVTNHLGESIELELARPELSGLAVLSVEGLGAVKGNVSFSEFWARFRNLAFVCRFWMA